MWVKGGRPHCFFPSSNCEICECYVYKMLWCDKLVITLHVWENDYIFMMWMLQFWPAQSTGIPRRLDCCTGPRSQISHGRWTCTGTAKIEIVIRQGLHIVCEKGVFEFNQLGWVLPGFGPLPAVATAASWPLWICLLEIRFWVVGPGNWVPHTPSSGLSHTWTIKINVYSRLTKLFYF